MQIEQGWQPSEIERLVDIENATASRLIFTDERYGEARVYEDQAAYLSFRNERGLSPEAVAHRINNRNVVIQLNYPRRHC